MYFVKSKTKALNTMKPKYERNTQNIIQSSTYFKYVQHELALDNEWKQNV